MFYLERVILYSPKKNVQANYLKKPTIRTNWNKHRKQPDSADKLFPYYPQKGRKILRILVCSRAIANCRKAFSMPADRLIGYERNLSNMSGINSIKPGPL
ncbi:hypothetical protein TNIN_388461 [Trichonephila inaurata madagascariensis]|uniref:Uncharacterized protein n=1 Tax=Trichonephila inaurata madagascariensis TaxID=2747483 RepID=A0A8X6XUX2_9ARAC|nr:hypothetical protein TNIN_388461 [Trichonephila inaurata madagascariensis]